MYKLNREIFNTVHLGIGFLLLFSADFTVNNLMPTIYERISQDNPEFSIDGYTGLGGLYLVYGLALWLAPSINSVIGPRIGMVIGALCITFHIYIIELELVWLIYFGIISSGFGGAIIWVGEGNYVVLNSNPTSLDRNISIFWVIYTTSMIFGNLYTAIQLEGVVDFDRETRVVLLRILTGVGIISAGCFCFLGRPAGVGDRKVMNEGPIEAFVKTFKLFLSKNMALLLFTFIYGGFQQSFGWSIYSTCMGFTKKFGPYTSELVPISGLAFGIGDVLGGTFHMMMSKRGLKWRRSSVICACMIIQILAFACTYINLPNESVFGPTEQISILEPNIALGLVCSFLIGIGDSCLNTQIFSLLAHLHPDHSAHTSALYKFTKSMSMAACFFAVMKLGLHHHLCLLLGMCIIGCLAFIWVDLRSIDKIKTYPLLETKPGFGDL